MLKINQRSPILIATFGFLLISLCPLITHSADLTHSTQGTDSTSPSDIIKNPETLLPIDDFESKLKKRHSSPHARLLKQAHDALAHKDYTKALRFSASSVKDPVFMDYGVWIAAQANRNLALIEFDKKSYPQALALIQKSVSYALKLQDECPYSPFLKSFPELLAQSELVKAEIFWATKNRGQAQIQYERAFQRLQHARSTIYLKPEELGHYAQSCKKNQTPICVSWLRKLTATFSKQRTAIQALMDGFPLPPEKRHSYRNPGQFSATYKSLDLDAIAFETAIKLYFEDKFKDSTKAFEQLLTDYPRSSYRSRALYWMAQAVAHTPETEKAKKLFADLQRESPLTYYGLLASRETGIPLESALDATLPLANDKETSLLPQEIFHLKRAENFIAENALELATFEFRDFRPRDSLSSPFLVYLAMLTYKARCYSLLFSILSELLHRDSGGILSAYGMHLIFPVEYFDLISKNTDEFKLDPLLVMSLIKQESSFDKGAGSSAGAMGLMQLMPSTALDTDPKVILAELLEPNENIRVGVKYLNKLVTRYKGNIVYALGAYNAGPSAMDRWIKAAIPKRGMTEFIESISYRETREYVAAIVRNYFWYSRRIKGADAVNLNYFWNTSGS
jgi:tetratricopeptide (TPR) repeat protein